MSFAGYFLARSVLSTFPAYLRTFFRFDLVWFRLSCDHGWIRSGSVNVRQTLHIVYKLYLVAVYLNVHHFLHVPKNARDFRPVFCLYFCYWPAAARHPGFQPLSLPPSCTVYTVVQQYALVDYYCCFHPTSGTSSTLGPYIVYRNRKRSLLSQPTLREEFVEKITRCMI